MAFVISEDEFVYTTLPKTVELLEGHTALFSQYYYGCLFHELLAFQLADRHSPAEVPLSLSLTCMHNHARAFMFLALLLAVMMILATNLK